MLVQLLNYLQFNDAFNSKHQNLILLKNIVNSRKQVSTTSKISNEDKNREIFFFNDEEISVS